MSSGHRAADRFDLSRGAAWMVALSPLVLLFGYSVALVAPRTRYVSQALLLEGSVVEDLTFGFAFAAGLLGLWLARRR